MQRAVIRGLLAEFDGSDAYGKHQVVMLINKVNLVFKMMNLELKVMNIMLKMMNLVLKLATTGNICALGKPLSPMGRSVFNGTILISN